MHLSRRVLAVAGTVTVLVGAGTAAGAAIAAGPVSSGVVSACYKTAAASNGSHAVVLEDTGHACPSGYTHLTWNQKGQTGPQGLQGPVGPDSVEFMYHYAPAGAPAQTSGWGFLSNGSSTGSTPLFYLANSDTGAYVTGTVDEAPTTTGSSISELLGICYEAYGSSSIIPVSSVAPEFAATAYSFFAQTVSGDVGGLPAGDYYIGLCAANQTGVANGDATVTFLLAETQDGIFGPRLHVASQADANRPAR